MANQGEGRTALREFSSLLFLRLKVKLILESVLFFFKLCLAFERQVSSGLQGSQRFGHLGSLSTELTSTTTQTSYKAYPSNNSSLHRSDSTLSRNMVAMDMDAFRDAIAKSLGYTLIATFFNVFLFGTYKYLISNDFIHLKADTVRNTFPFTFSPGFTLVQTYQYFNRYSHDRLSLRCLVSLVFILDTLDSTNLVVVCWRYLISGYADIFLAQISVWNLSAVPAVRWKDLLERFDPLH